MKKFNISPDEAKQFTKLYFQKAQEADVKRDWKEAIICYTVAIDLQPRKISYYEERAETYVMIKKYALAKADYDQAIKLKHKNDYAFYRRGVIKTELNKDYNPLYDLTKAIMINPKEYTYYAYRAELHIKRKDYNNAIADLTQAVRILQHPKGEYPSLLVKLYARRAQVYCINGQSALALDDCNRALRIEPDHAQYLLIKGICFEGIGLPELAYNTLRRAHTKADTKLNYYCWLAEQRMQHQDWEGALEDLNEAIEIYKNHEAYALRAELKAALDDQQGALEDFQLAYTLKA